jgi:hypothetical protein
MNVAELLKLLTGSAALRAILEDVVAVVEPLLKRLPDATEAQLLGVIRSSISGVDALLPEIVVAVKKLASTGKGPITKDDSALV